MPQNSATMRQFGQCVEGRLTLTAEEIALPADQQRRETIVDAIGERLGRDLLEEYEVSPTAIHGHTGYYYHQVDDRCPACGTRLRLTRGYLDAENGAQATAECQASDCSWSGQAIYRLVDLEGGIGEDVESAVVTGAIDPTSVPY